MDGILCDYDTGMFALEPHDEPVAHDMLAHLIEQQKAAYHEAAHAALSHALGHGLSSISLMTTIIEQDGRKTIGYHGKTGAKWGTGRVTISYHSPRQFLPVALVSGIVTAAGPAAERKYCLLNHLPVRVQLAAEGDHVIIERLAVKLEREGRSRAAFHRFIWRRAQLALEDPTIWGAVTELGETLNNSYWPGSSDVGKHRCTMPGEEARDILEAAGVRAHRDRPREVIDYPGAPSVRVNLEAFARAAAGIAPYPIATDQMLLTVEALEAVFKSAKSGAIAFVR